MILTGLPMDEHTPYLGVQLLRTERRAMKFPWFVTALLRPIHPAPLSHRFLCSQIPPLSLTYMATGTRKRHVWLAPDVFEMQ